MFLRTQAANAGVRASPFVRLFVFPKDEEDDLNALCISYNEEHDSASSPEMPHSILEMQEAFRRRQQQQQQGEQQCSIERVLTPATSTDGDSDVRFEGWLCSVWCLACVGLCPS